MSKQRNQRSNSVPDATDASNQSSQRLPVWKKPIYSTVFCATFFVVLELVLALLGVQPVLESRDPYVGFESTIPLFVEQTDDKGKVTLTTAKNKLAYFNAQQFAKKKPERAYRVFCLGGSTTYGRPYDDTTSFPGWLRRLLPVADSSRDWEVINAGGVSYASYRITALMDELTAFQPDLFIIFAGHNEFLEERTYREVKQSPSALRRVTALASRTRTYALLYWILRPSAAEGDRIQLPGEVNARLDHTVGPSDYVRDDALRSQILDHYQFNLEQMIQSAREAGADVLLVVPTSNVKDCSPFKSQHVAGLSETQLAEWSSLYDRGESLEATGQLDEALAAYRQAAEIDGRYAELHYRIGRLFFELCRLAEARAAFDRAVDEDVCPLRALPRMQEIVRETAERLSVPVIDAEELLKTRCLRAYGHNSPGGEFFLDHVHPTIATNRLFAVTIIERLIEEGIVDAQSTWDDEAIEAVAADVEAKIDPQQQAIALRNLAKVLNWAGKHEEAGPLALQAVELRERRQLSEDPEALLLAAAFLKESGKVETAIQHYQKSLVHNPDYVEAHQMLGAALVEQRRFDDARSHFLQVIRLSPDDAHAHHMVGAVLAESQRFAEAIPYYKTANRLKPNDADIHYNMAFALAKLGKRKDAMYWYRRTLELDPDDIQARKHLNELLTDPTEHRDTLPLD